jgi:hypothetical protein
LGDTTAQSILVEHLESFAECYQQHWQQHAKKDTFFFLKIEGINRIPTPIAQAPTDRTYSTRCRNALHLIIGDLTGLWNEEMGMPDRFEAACKSRPRRPVGIDGRSKIPMSGFTGVRDRPTGRRFCVKW